MVRDPSIRRRDVLLTAGGILTVGAVGGWTGPTVAQSTSEPDATPNEIVDYEFTVGATTDADAESEPQVTFGDDSIRITGRLVIGSSSCKTVALSELEYDEDEGTLRTVVSDAEAENPPTAGGQRVCTDDISSESYGLTVTFDDGVPDTVLAAESARQDQWRTIRIVDPAEREPDVAGIEDYEFTLDVDHDVDPDDDPRISFADEEVVVSGALWTGSGSCKTAGLSRVAYDEDDASLTVGVVDRWVSPIVLEGGPFVDCTDDMNEESYELRVAVDGDAPTTVIATEDGVEGTREARVDRGGAGLPSPSGLEVTATTPTAIGLRWDHVSDAVDYRLYLDGELERESADRRGIAIAGLEPDTSYEIGVTAVDESGSESDVETISVTTESDTGDIPRPENLTVLETTAREIEVAWDGVTPAGDDGDWEVDHYRVSWEPVQPVAVPDLVEGAWGFKSTFQGEITVPADSSSATLEELWARRTYVVTVTAVAESGAESIGATVTATTDDDPPTAELTFPDQHSDGTRVIVEDVSLSEPGFVSLRREAPGGDLLGVSDYLDAGEYDTIEIELDDPLEEETTLVALPHRDTTENGSYDHEDGSDVDYPYTRAGTPLTSPEATITVESTPPNIGGYEPADTTGDGLYNDVTGSGSTTTTDVNVFFEHVDEPVVTDYPEYYDFDGNGDVSISDVVELFESL